MRSGRAGGTSLGVPSHRLPPGLHAQHSFFPLPLVPVSKPVHCHGRRQSQRQDRARRLHEEMNEAVLSLNWLQGFGFSAPPAGRLSPLQLDSLERIRNLASAASDLGDLARAPTQEAALRDLLHGKTEYFEPSSPVSLAPYNLELISLPASLVDAPRAENLLGQDDLRYLQEQERIVRTEKPDTSHITPFWDPALKNNPRNYRKFLQKLNSIGYLEFTLEPQEFAGVFFVWKSDKKRIRMIVDGRAANAQFHEPPSVSLSTAETFSRIEIAMPQELVHDHGARREYMEQIQVCAGLSDVKDCFHRIKQPRWLAKVFLFYAN